MREHRRYSRLQLSRLKQYLSPISTESAKLVRALVEATFLELTQRLSFAADWLETFIDINRLPRGGMLAKTQSSTRQPPLRHA
jgi:hypothetical protein